MAADDRTLALSEMARKLSEPSPEILRRWAEWSQERWSLTLRFGGGEPVPVHAVFEALAQFREKATYRIADALEDGDA